MPNLTTITLGEEDSALVIKEDGRTEFYTPVPKEPNEKDGVVPNSVCLVIMASMALNDKDILEVLKDRYKERFKVKP